MKRCHSTDDSGTTPTDSDEAPSSAKICSIPNPNYFPSDVLKFMKQNAKPRMSLKLMNVCKYFKHKNFPYLVVKFIKHCWGEWTYETLDGKFHSTDNLADIPNNLWIIDRIIVSIKDINFQAFVEKIVASDAESMHFVSQTIPFNLIKPLCVKVKNFTSISCYLRDANRDIISLDELFEGLPNLENFTLNLYCPSIVSVARAHRAVPPNLKIFHITNFHETFNFATFAKFMLQHQNMRYIFDSNQQLQLEYLGHLNLHIGRVILGWDCQNRPPKIQYCGQTYVESDALSRLQDLHNALQYYAQLGHY